MQIKRFKIRRLKGQPSFVLMALTFAARLICWERQRTGGLKELSAKKPNLPPWWISLRLALKGILIAACDDIQISQLIYEKLVISSFERKVTAEPKLANDKKKVIYLVLVSYNLNLYTKERVYSETWRLSSRCIQLLLLFRKAKPGTEGKYWL